MNASASVQLSTGPGVPGTMGTPTFKAITRRSTTSRGASSQEALTDRTSLGLVTKLVDDLGRGTDERKSSLLDLARELCVFGEETISVGRKAGTPD